MLSCRFLSYGITLESDVAVHHANSQASCAARGCRSFQADLAYSRLLAWYVSGQVTVANKDPKRGRRGACESKVLTEAGELNLNQLGLLGLFVIMAISVVGGSTALVNAADGQMSLPTPPG